MKRTLILLIFGFILLLSACGGRNSTPPAPTRAAADGVKFMQLDSAWQIELWASEPLFADPVAMEIDEYGRTYVVQNSGYPLDTEHKLGKVWLLEDANSDGKPDKSTLFAGDLMPHRRHALEEGHPRYRRAGCGVPRRHERRW